LQSANAQSASLKIQLWSYNFDPEPTGIGIVSTVWARGLRDRGHDVSVVAAHPHYPEPNWGTRRRPYREVRDGIPVLRLPLWIGRASAAQRYRQELSFLAAQSLATPFLGHPDVMVSALRCCRRSPINGCGGCPGCCGCMICCLMARPRPGL
jgi:colanic acid biosynthesis glycosyl transferase WcaI